MKEIQLWKPVCFDKQTWGCADTTALDRIAPSWMEYRAKLNENEGDYKKFIEKLKYEHAIETGIIERLYDIGDEQIPGITMTLLKDGINSNFLQHEGVENIDAAYAFIRSQYEAMDGLFKFIKDERPLSTSYIKELHAVVTRSQDTTEAITSTGKIVHVPLLKGEYKKQDNNPSRPGDNIVFKYCSPFEVGIEMENLLRIYNGMIDNKVHPIIRAAFFHHAITIIHPFQDGNGRVTRLLTSLILVRDNYFPFSVKPKERIAYLDALAQADEGNIQPFVNIISTCQIRAIESALSLKRPSHGTLDAVVDALKDRLKEKEVAKKEELNKRRDDINSILAEHIKHMQSILRKKLGCDIYYDEAASNENLQQRMTYQMVIYAKKFGYFMKKNMPSHWFKLNFCIGEQRFMIILFTHHFGQTDDAIVIGGVLETKVKDGQLSKHIRQAWSGDVNIIPLELPPLKLSLLADINEITKSDIQRHVEQLILVSMAGVISEI
jgi:Fic family protein